MHSLNYNEDLEAKYRMLKSETRTCFIYGFVLHAACFFFYQWCAPKNVRNEIFPMVLLLIIASERKNGHKGRGKLLDVFYAVIIRKPK